MADERSVKGSYIKWWRGELRALGMTAFPSVVPNAMGEIFFNLSSLWDPEELLNIQSSKYQHRPTE